MPAYVIGPKHIKKGKCHKNVQIYERYFNSTNHIKTTITTKPPYHLFGIRPDEYRDPDGHTVYDKIKTNKQKIKQACTL